MLEAKERRIHQCGPSCKIIRGIVLVIVRVRRWDHQNLRRRPPLKVSMAMLRAAVGGIASAAPSGSTRCRPNNGWIGAARRKWARGEGPGRESYDGSKEKNNLAEQNSPSHGERVREMHHLILAELQRISAPHRYASLQHTAPDSQILNNIPDNGSSSPLTSGQGCSASGLLSAGVPDSISVPHRQEALQLRSDERSATFVEHFKCRIKPLTRRRSILQKIKSSRLLKNSGCRLLKKIQRRGARKIDPSTWLRTGSRRTCSVR
jgi:hypothetical protein